MLDPLFVKYINNLEDNVVNEFANDTEIGDIVDSEGNYLSLQQDLDSWEGRPRNGKWILTAPLYSKL